MENVNEQKIPDYRNQWVRLKSNKSIAFKISISNPNGILEYYSKNSHTRENIHYSLVEPINDPNVIGELEVDFDNNKTNIFNENQEE